MRDITKDKYLKDTEKVSQVNNYTPLAPRSVGHYDCVSSLTHCLICKHILTTSIGNDSVANRRLLCDKCRARLLQIYNISVNNKKFEYAYEPFEDSYIQHQVYTITNNIVCTHPHLADDNSKNILADLIASMKDKSKTYSQPLKNSQDSYEFLTKQGIAVEEDNNEIKIKFPLDRDFPIKDEMQAIRVIAKEKNGEGSFDVNFKDHEIIIKEAN